MLAGQREALVAHQFSLRLLLVFICSLYSEPANAAFGPGEAAARSKPGRADFKVLVWYRHADPLGTFKYVVYDVRKGEYSPAVDTWLQGVQTNYPAYVAFGRDVYLDRVQGKTEALKVGAVIKRELMVAAALSGVVIGGPGSILHGPSYSSQNRTAGLNRQPGAIANDRSFLNPASTSFPVPIPYPRPHP
jgi:hypothetical protein